MSFSLGAAIAGVVTTLIVSCATQPILEKRQFYGGYGMFPGGYPGWGGFYDHPYDWDHFWDDDVYYWRRYRLTPGAIVGICIGAIVGLGLIVGIIVLVMRRNSNSTSQPPQQIVKTEYVESYPRRPPSPSTRNY